MVSPATLLPPQNWAQTQSIVSPATLLPPQNWAQATFGAVDLGDRRRNQRAVRIAQALATNPNASFPRQMTRDADLQATYRFLHSASTSYEALIEPHLHTTRQACRHHQQVLLIQDTTELDYQHHPTTTGLGPVGTGSHHGFLVQSVLAVEPRSRRVLGLAHQEPFLRQPAPAKESKQQRLHRERESQVWNRSVQALGSPPAQSRWVHVGDRYSDIFPFLLLCRQTGCDFPIRAAQDRCVDLLVEHDQELVAPRSHHPEYPSAPSLHLFEVVEQMPPRASHWIEVPSSQKHAARRAHVAISWQALRLLPPRAHEAQKWPPLVVWVIHVWEPEAPEGVEPLKWVLLTSVPTRSLTEAQERIDWYRARWMVEDYHQGLKTGCRIEQRHLQDYEGLKTALGLLAPTAVRLLQLRTLAREMPDEAALRMLPGEVVQVVAQLVHTPAEALTVQQCWHGIARQGGYLGRKSDGPPGWKTLWHGWVRVQTLLEGVHLASHLSDQLKL
jgi:hypothetical protein